MSCVKSIVVLIVLALLSQVTTHAQKLDDLQKEKERTRQNIALTNKLLDETKKSSTVSLNKLQMITVQVGAQKKLINQIQQELDLTQSKITTNTLLTKKLSGELDQAKQEYAKLLYNLYFRSSKYDDILFILSANNMSTVYRRTRYLKELSDYRKNQANLLITMQSDLDQQTNNLIKSQTRKKALAEEKEQEKEELLIQKDEQDSYIASLKQKEKDLKSQLRDYQQKAERLNKNIQKVIVEQTSKNAKRSDKEKKVDIKLSTDFANNRGKLPWPALHGVIVSGFGKNSVTKNIVMDNSGVDIQTGKNSIATAVFNGEVTGLFAIPGYNNTVIIRHGKYLTVYSNLTDVSVSKGDRVSTGQTLGHIFTDTKDGNKTILHFEVWKETVKQNPAIWLR